MQNQNAHVKSFTVLTSVITIIVSVSGSSLAISLAHQGQSDKIMDKRLSEARGQIAKLGHLQEKTNYPDLKLYSGNDTEKREWIQSQWQDDCGDTSPQKPCRQTKPPKPEPPPKPTKDEPPRKQTSDEKSD